MKEYVGKQIKIKNRYSNNVPSGKIYSSIGYGHLDEMENKMAG